MSDPEGLTDTADVEIPVFAAPSLEGQTLELPEDSSQGTVIPLSIEDADTSLANLNVSLFGGNADNDGNGQFVFSEPTFNQDAGQWEVAINDNDELDVEQFPGDYNLQIQASDGERAENATTTVELTNVNEAPEFSEENFLFDTVSDGTQNGSSVDSVFANDPEGDNFEFSITGGNDPDDNGKTAFSIDPNTGDITVLDSNELTQNFQLEVTATETGTEQGLASTASVSIPVDIDQANQADPPIIVNDNFELDLDFADTDSTVDTLRVSDSGTGQSFNVSITNGNDPDGNGTDAFQVVDNFGSFDLTVNDINEVTTQESFTLEVTAEDTNDSNLSDTATINVTPFTTPNIQNDFIDLGEDAQGLVTPLNISDSNTALENLTVTLVNGNRDSDGDGEFIFNSPQFNQDQGQWEVTVNDSDELDADIQPFQYNLDIQVSNGSRSNRGTITVNVTGVNEAPVLEDANFDLIDLAGATEGDVVGTVSAEDEEGDALAFTLTDAEGNEVEAFDINPDTGEITVANPEALTAQEFQLEVTAAEAETAESLSGTATITIPVDAPPELAANEFSFTIAENSDQGSEVGQVTAPEGNAIASFSIASSNLDGDNNPAFAIDNSGNITVNDPDDLNFEPTAGQLLNQVTATKENGLSTRVPVTIELDDVNEAPTAENTILAPLGVAFQNIEKAETAEDRETEAEDGNDTIDTASPTNLDANSPGSFVAEGLIGNNPNFAPGLDVDLYSLQLEEGETVSISTEVFSNSNLNPLDSFIRVFNSAGNANSVRFEEAFAGEFLFNASLTFEAPASDTYFIGVSSAENDLYDPLTAGSGEESSEFEFSEDPLPYELNINVVSQVQSVSSGDVVGTVPVSDPDLGENFEFTILDGNNDNNENGTEALAVNNQGEIIVADPDDVEENFRLTVEVTDAGGSTAQSTVVVPVNDVPPQPPLAANTSFSIAENSSEGSVVGSVPSSDPDFNNQASTEALTFSIAEDAEDNTDVNGNGISAFEIDETTGEILVADTEDLNFENTSSFELTVEVTDSEEETDTATIGINLEDVNERPELSNRFLNRVTLNPVDPDAVANDDPVGTLDASDPEGTEVEFELRGGNNPDNDSQETFALNANGELTVANQGELSEQDFFSLEVAATDETGVETVTQVVVPIGTQNPTVEDQSFSIAEDASFEDVIGTVAASDPQDQELEYFIDPNEGEFAPFENAIKVDQETGELSVNENTNALDFEENEAFDLTVVARNPQQAIDTATVTVNLEDVTEAPVLSERSDFTTAANSPNGRAVGQVPVFETASQETLLEDLEGVSFNIVGGNENRNDNDTSAFSIDDNGVITVADNGDLPSVEDDPFQLEVEASVQDGDGNPVASTTEVNVSAVPPAPIIENNGTTFGLNTDSFETALVGTVDVAGNENNEFTFDLTEVTQAGEEVESPFQIDSETGELQVADPDALEDIADNPFEVTVNVTDEEGDTTEGNFTVTSGAGSFADSIEGVSFSTPLPPTEEQENPTSDLVRSGFPSTEVLSIENTGDAPLLISDVVVNEELGDRVTTNFEELIEEATPTSDSGRPILELPGLEIGAGANLELEITYTPDEGGENFSLDNGLTLVSNAPENSEINVALSGQSTFNSDLNYDGSVGMADVELADSLFNTSADELEPARNIDGKGGFGFSDIATINEEFGSELG